MPTSCFETFDGLWFERVAKAKGMPGKDGVLTKLASEIWTEDPKIRLHCGAAKKKLTKLNSFICILSRTD